MELHSKTNDAYPSQYESEVLLRDGSSIILRPIRRDDTERWLAFVSRLSPRTKYLRFHYLPKQMSQEDACRFCTVDYENAFAFVAEVRGERGEEIVAIGRYYRLHNKHAAEVAFAIQDSYQGRGLGTKLMERLVAVARDNAISTFEAFVLAENKHMMAVFRGYGFHIKSELAEGVYNIVIPIAPTRRTLKKEEERERISTVASLRPILYPRSVAVVGASRKPGSIGQLIFQCLVENGFSGVAYPVNPNADAVMSVKAYPSVLDVPGEVDLAVIVVPAPLVAKVADECGQKGVRTIIVISDGFKERGPEGAERESELRDIAFGHGMRILGPNCMGIINTDPAVSLNATFSKIYPPRGDVAFLSQSGALGVAILDYAKSLNMGISSFVSVGNRADISANDFLQYWEEDSATRVILLYLESFGNPRKFARIARRVSAKKPIVIVKSGTSPAGLRAASSHTGALATPEVASNALFLQAGMIRVNSLEELFDVATLLSTQPVPKGKRVAIVTNGGGPGILAADACERQGLVLPEFSSDTVKALTPVIRRDISIRNPLDITAGALEKEYEGALKVLANDKSIDAVIVLFIPATMIDPTGIEEVTERVAPIFQRRQKPLLACFIGQRGIRGHLGSGGRFVPRYAFPDDAVSALAQAAHYGEWLRKPKGTVAKIRGIKRKRAREVIEGAMPRTAERPFWLSGEEITELLDSYGIDFVNTLTAKTAAEAATYASKLGFPIAVKLASSTITHKSDVGGVVLDLNSESEVKGAYNNIRAKLTKIGRAHEMDGVIVQRMVPGGIEAIVGMKHDPSFGPLIMFGLGGVYAELFEDIAVMLHPLTDLDAKELIRSIKMAKLFEGFRGSPPADVVALQDLLLRLSALIEDVPEIAELDFNPVKVMAQGQGYRIVDARVLLR